MLASTADLLRYRARAGDVTHPVSDILFTPQNLSLTYLMVDFGSWIDSAQLLVDASRIRSVNTAQAEVVLDASARDLDDAPRWDGDGSGLDSLLSALPPLVVGPFGATHAPLALAAEMAPERGPAHEDPRAESALSRSERVTEWIGATVFVSDGEAGSLASLLYDPDLGRMTHLVIDNDKVLAGKLLVVPAATLRHRATGGHIVLDIPRRTLDAAPQIDEMERLARHWVPGVNAYFVPPM